MTAEVAASVAPPRPGTKAWLQAELRAAHEQIAELREADRDIAHLVDAIYKECMKRGWCSEYEVFVRFHNKRLSKPRLIPRNTNAERATAAMANVVTNCQCESCNNYRAIARDAGYPPER